jgi:hypothetical protein
MHPMKTCNKCKETLEYDKFAKNRSQKDGYENYCKSCKNLYNKKNYGNKFTKSYLKKEGYTNKGEIYRIITLDPLVVMIKQNTEYIDLYRFLEDNQNIEPYSDLYSTYQDEKEVVARLDSNFSFEDIHYASSTGMNMDPFLKN